MSDQKKKEYLISKGWHTWYSDDYWVHRKTITDSSRQDYTEYGLDLQSAYEYEINPDSKPWDGQLLHGTWRW